MIFRALDFRFKLLADPPLDAEFARALAPIRDDIPTAVGDASNIPTVSVTRDGSEWSIVESGTHLRARSVGRAVARTLEHINQRAAASIVSGAPLHAAAIRQQTHPVLALAGASGSGKSTLCAAAIRSGWGLVAEEVTVIDSAHSAVPYRRPIGLRRGGAAAIDVGLPDDPAGLYSDVYPWPVPPESWAAGGPLGGIALVDRRPGPAVLTRLEPAAALAELVEHVVVPDDGRVIGVFRTLESIVRSIPVVRIQFDQPPDGLGLLRDLVLVT